MPESEVKNKIFKILGDENGCLNPSEVTRPSLNQQKKKKKISSTGFCSSSELQNRQMHKSCLRAEIHVSHEGGGDPNCS